MEPNNSHIDSDIICNSPYSIINTLSALSSTRPSTIYFQNILDINNYLLIANIIVSKIYKINLVVKIF